PADQAGRHHGGLAAMPKKRIMDTRKVALVTGSATGIGAATVLELSRRGYNVLITYSKSEEEARESQSACRQAGADTLLLRGDVAKDADCRAMVTAVIERWGRLDALVNNAGMSVFGSAASWDALDAQAFQRVLGVNAVGTFQMVRACVPHLKKAQGSIVNVSSIAGALGIGSSVPYIASKGAVNAMTLHLARELAPEIRVNAVCPGLVTSRWFVDGVGQAGFDKVKAGYELSAPLARASTPEDVTDAIVWLIEGARAVTGELLLLDGGMHLGARRPVEAGKA
ncbi:MAG: SDR family NAD(P)-dependent oxidoreductase, partial [Ramlibacter sp.]